MSVKDSRPRLAPAVLCAAALCAPAAAGLFSRSEPLPSYALSLTERGFEPRTLAIPAGRKVVLLVSNATSEPVEFESFSLHREQVVPAGAKVSVFVGPLKPGRYDFRDDFHPSRAGEIVVSTAAAR